MTVTARGDDVTVLCGALDENWVAIEREMGSQLGIEIIRPGDLNHPEGYDALYEHIEAQTAAFDFDFERYLPLDVEVDTPERGRYVTVRDGDGVILAEHDVRSLTRLRERDPDDGERSEGVLALAQSIDRVHTAPRRWLFEHRDDLPER
jgi:hypothetical protein